MNNLFVKLHCWTNYFKNAIFCFKAIVSEPFECVGRWFESCVIRQRSEKSSLSFVKTDEKEEDDEEDNTNDILTKEEKEFILKLDAAEWKVRL